MTNSMRAGDKSVLFQGITLLLLALLASGSFLNIAHAAPRYTRTIEAEFDDVIFDMKDAIVNQGLVLEHKGDIATMLERTAMAVTGKQVATYLNARYLLFCSAKITHAATAIDPNNISVCPFIIYAYETKKTPGKITLGYRNPDLGETARTDPIYISIHAYLKKLIDSIADSY